MSVDKEKLARELVILLLQVAWADGEIAEEERAHILDLADRAGLGAADRVAFEACLAGEAKLPAPDMGFLRQHAQAAMRAAEALVMADQEVDEGESTTLDELRELLGLS